MNACELTNMKLWKVRDTSIFVLFGKCFVPFLFFWSLRSNKKKNSITFRTRPESVPDVQEGYPSDTWDCPTDKISKSPETGRVGTNRTGWHRRPSGRPVRSGALRVADWTDGSNTDIPTWKRNWRQEIGAFFGRDTHRKNTHVFCHVGFVWDYLYS